MKRQQKSVWSSLKAFAAISMLFGTAAVTSAQQQMIPRIDGVYTDPRSAEVNRAIFLRPDSFGESALIVGTGKGNALFSKMKADDLLFKQPVFKPFSMPQPSGALVRDINFVGDNKGYMLKNDGIYFSDGRTDGWQQIMSTVDLPSRPNAVAELWSMSFVTDLRVCIAGVYLKSTGDRSIDQELLFCTDDISRRDSRWNKPDTPSNGANEQIQFTNIYFDKYQHGWVVGTDGAEGIVWYSRDGGREWEDQQVNINSPLLSVSGTGNNVVGVGFNGVIFGRGAGKKNNESLNLPDSRNDRDSRDNRNSRNDRDSKDNRDSRNDRDSRDNRDSRNNNDDIKEGDTVEIRGSILSRAPGAERVYGRVERINRQNGMMRVKITEVIPESVRSVVENIFRNIEVSRRDVEKVDDDEETDNRNSSNTNNRNSSNTNNRNSSNTNSFWEKASVFPALRNPTVSLRSVKFADNGSDGFIVGDKGTILYTQDGGTNWKPLIGTPAQQTQLNPVDFYAVFIDRKYCWIAGTKGTVVRVKYAN